MRLFDRRWRVQVGSLDVSELACSFKIKRSVYARAGTCEITIRNLNEQHRREITTAPRRTTYVEVQAGYVDGVSLLFRGDLRKAIPAQDGTDWTVTVTAGDGEHALRTARVFQSFAQGSSVESALRAIADALGVGVGNAVTALRAARFSDATEWSEGTVLRGLASSELTRLCASAGLSWSVQDGALQVLPLGGALEREAVLLSPSSGLLAAPEVVNRRTIALKTLMIPGLSPGQLVVLDSAIARGTWRVSEIEFAGDTHGPEWGASITAHRPRPPLVAGA